MRRHRKNTRHSKTYSGYYGYLKFRSISKYPSPRQLSIQALRAMGMLRSLNNRTSKFNVIHLLGIMQELSLGP